MTNQVNQGPATGPKPEGGSSQGREAAAKVAPNKVDPSKAAETSVWGVWGSVLLALGLLLLFVAERIVVEGNVWKGLLAAGSLAVVVAFALRFASQRQARGAAAEVEQSLLFAYFGALAALVLYLLSTEWGLGKLHLTGSAAERTATAFAALWPAVMTVSMLTVFFIEFAYRRMPIAEAVELRRVRNAAYGGTGLGFALVFLLSLNYVAHVKEVKRDLSYFKTTKPSDSTLKMARGLGEKLEVVLFYPKVNEVYEQLTPYFDAIDKASAKLTVKRRDHALSPELAAKHRVRGNGYVVLVRGQGATQQAEKFEVGVNLEDARKHLKELDSDFQKAFNAIAKTRRELYITSGHREHTGEGEEGDAPGLRISELKEALGRSNIGIQSYGMAQGLARQVPPSAPAVAVIGPREPFLEEEAQALLQYVKQGGRLLLLLDPNAKHGLDSLLKGLGLELLPGVVCSEQNHLRRNFNAADKGIIFTNRYSAHPIVTIASRNSTRVASVFVEGGALKRQVGSEAVRDIAVVFPVRSGAGFWRDLDGDFERDAEEPSEEFDMVAAVTVPNKADKEREGRVVVIADGDFVTDQIIRNPGNVFVFSDITQWLIGEEQIVGEATSEEDVRIEHTRDQDKVWFYATSFGAPLPILGLGIWMAMRRRRKRGAKQ